MATPEVSPRPSRPSLELASRFPSRSVVGLRIGYYLDGSSARSHGSPSFLRSSGSRRRFVNSPALAGSTAFDAQGLTDAPDAAMDRRRASGLGEADPSCLLGAGGPRAPGLFWGLARCRRRGFWCARDVQRGWATSSRRDLTARTTGADVLARCFRSGFPLHLVVSRPVCYNQRLACERRSPSQWVCLRRSSAVFVECGLCISNSAERESAIATTRPEASARAARLHPRRSKLRKFFRDHSASRMTGVEPWNS